MIITEINSLPAPTVSDRRETLRWLARGWNGFGAAVRNFVLTTVVDPSMRDVPLARPCTCGMCMWCTWEAYLTDLSHLDGLNREVWADGLLGIDEGLPHEVRLDNASQRVAGIEDLLLRGVGAR